MAVFSLLGLKTRYLALFCLLPSLLLAQSNQRCQWLRPGQMLRDSLAIAPTTVYMAQQVPSTAQAVLRFNSLAQAYMLEAHPSLDSAQVCYRVFPFAWGTSQLRILPAQDTAQYIDALANTVVPLETASLFTIKGIDGEAINSSGQISRGIAVGNGASQDAALTSSLNLQLEGPIAPGIQLNATLTDQQLPFQPEGNTQRLQDFDRILLELKHEKWRLQAGDIRLQQDSASYFLRYFKNVQGAQAQASWKDSLGGKHILEAGISAAKGVFHSQQLQGIERVQGPYRLRGANGERFIVVIAGSERIYLDGKLLQRGYEADYVIDYNASEITFTSRVLITQYSRIRADFEYAIQQYARGIATGRYGYAKGRWQAQARFYCERDNRNAPLLFDLNQEAREQLELAGDSLASISSAAPINAFQPYEVLYFQKDSLHEGQIYQIFVRALQAGEGLFSVQFTEVGQGKGNYVLEATIANGRVFRWVAPVQGVPQGNFSHIRVLPAPNQKQLLALGGEYTLGKYAKLFAEAAFSNHDLNLLSEKGNADNQGGAFRMGYQLKQKPTKLLGGGRLSALVLVEHDQAFFRPIDRFREPDFDREWGIAELQDAPDYIGSASITFEKDAKRWLRYEAAVRQRTGQTAGWQQRVAWHWQRGHWHTQGEGFLMQAKQPGTRTTWQRADAQLDWQGRAWVPGYRFFADQNRLLESDSVANTAMFFTQHEFFMKSSDSLAKEKPRLQTSYAYRTDWLPVEGEMQPHAFSHNAMLVGSKRQKGLFINALLAYRQLTYTNKAKEETVNGQFDWDQEFLGKTLKSSLRFATSAGRELKRAFVFLPVDVGQGTHNWQDLNENGTQELDEFLPAIFADDRRYAKFFVPTDEYVLAFAPQATYRLQWQMPVKWKQAKGWKQWASRFSGVSSLQSAKRTANGLLASRLLPWQLGQETADVLSARGQVRHAVFFNRNEPTFGAEWQQSRSQNLLLLTTGFQQQERREQQWQVRWSPAEAWLLRASFKNQTSENKSDALPLQQYSISGNSLSPEANYQPNPRVRLTGSYQWQRKIGHQASGNAAASFHEWALAWRYSQSSQSSQRTLSASAGLKQVKGPSEASPMNYELLEALRPGRNLLWEAAWQQTLTGGLLLQFRYQGRKLGDSRAIHLGSVQLQAQF